METESVNLIIFKAAMVVIVLIGNVAIIAQNISHRNCVHIFFLETEELVVSLH